MQISQHVFYIFVIMITVFFPFSSYAEQPLNRVSFDIPNEYINYEIVEASLIVRSPDGNTYRISRLYSANNLPAYNNQSWPETNPNIVPVYWGEEKLTVIFEKINTGWMEIKNIVKKCLKLVEDSISYVGVVILLVGTGVLTFLLNSSFPLLPKHIFFYSIFILLSFLWVYITSIYKSVIYTAIILIMPHLILLTIAFVLEKMKRNRLQ